MESQKKTKPNTLPKVEILSGKNAWTWVSMVLYLKKKIKIKILKPIWGKMGWIGCAI